VRCTAGMAGHAGVHAVTALGVNVDCHPHYGDPFVCCRWNTAPWMDMIPARGRLPNNYRGAPTPSASPCRPPVGVLVPRQFAAATMTASGAPRSTPSLSPRSPCAMPPLPSSRARCGAAQLTTVSSLPSASRVANSVRHV